MPAVLDIEQAILLLELEPPFDKRQVQMARRRMAKRWHPDIAPPGKQFEHERHLKAINQAADQLESLADGSRGGGGSRQCRHGGACPGARAPGASRAMPSRWPLPGRARRAPRRAAAPTRRTSAAAPPRSTARST